MKKHLLLLLTFLTLLPLSAAQILADNGKSSFVIVHCGQRSEYGATLIQKLLRQATKANLPVIHEKDYKKGTPAIFVGATREAKAKKLILSHQFPTKDISLYEEEARLYFKESYASVELLTIEI